MVFFLPCDQNKNRYLGGKYLTQKCFFKKKKWERKFKKGFTKRYRESKRYTNTR